MAFFSQNGDNLWKFCKGRVWNHSFKWLGKRRSSLVCVCVCVSFYLFFTIGFIKKVRMSETYAVDATGHFPNKNGHPRACGDPDDGTFRMVRSDASHPQAICHGPKEEGIKKKH